MKLSWFSSVILILLVGLLQIYHWTATTFDEKDVLRHKIHQLTAKLRQSELKTAMIEDQFFGFRQEVAMNLPSFLKEFGETPQGYAGRSLASVTQEPDSAKRFMANEALSSVAFEKARESFVNKNYGQAAAQFQKFVDRWGYSSKAPEAYFLMVESLYQEGRLEEAVSVIQRMIDLFPGHEVAGFSMIRLGKIMESKGHASDAIEIYKTVLRTFPQREVASQAKASLSGVSF
ncbi:MAG TPA: hypothetical protein DCL41_05220 [Bdellovibrionales bacterium]|nr:hypothetical protein [Pseudobdellovibrionaceae bacterium]HAG91248.1 hypothetical protein [Bdellovibrionales bacterium]|tara:strand:- start:4323 stop:5018 length:696 start_codon:yes stop_codon:yes gene_type:complete